jgi:hypothetical protein
VLPEVVAGLGIGADQVIAVRVRFAGLGELRRGLGVTERKAEPERGRSWKFQVLPPLPDAFGCLLGSLGSFMV